MKMTKPLYNVRDVRDLRDLVNQSAEIYGDGPAFRLKNEKGEIYPISYKQYRKDIDIVGTALNRAGFHGHKIGLAGNNSYKWCLSYLSVVCGGDVIVPIDKELLFPEIKNIFDIAEVNFIFCDVKFLGKLLERREELPDGFTIVCFDYPEDKDGVLSFGKFYEDGKAALEAGDKRYLDFDIDPEKMCSLLFTSGTTGASKGVMLSHKNLCSDVFHAMQVVKASPKDQGISILPLHHTYESTLSMFMANYCGANLAFCENLKYVTKSMQEYEPTFFISVSLLLEKVHRRILKSIQGKKNGSVKFKLGKALCKAGDLVGVDLREKFFKEIQSVFGGRMRLIICGAAPINPKILEDFDAFGIQIIFGYGLTECAPLVICNNDKLHLTKSIGVPLPDVETKIINADPETKIGELCVRGPMVMLGYYKDPEATAKVLDADGWFRTGDLAYVDRWGHFYITGRCKNVIVTKNGKNIYPEEVEHYLGQHNYVAECVVFGGYDENDDTIVEASIFPNFEELEEVFGRKDFTRDELMEIFAPIVEETNKKLPHFKQIVTFDITETEFVKTTTNKIQRHKINKVNLQAGKNGRHNIQTKK